MNNLGLRLRRKWLAKTAPVFPSYQAALGASKGYVSDDILETVQRKSAAWALRKHELPQSAGLAILQTALNLLDRPHVIDFGGALGSHYWQLKGRPMRWSVVETTAMAALGKPTDELSFYDGLAKAGPADIVYCSSVLPYVPDPFAMARELATVPARMIVVDRQYLHPGSGFGLQYSLLSENGPGPLVDTADRIVAYPFAFMEEAALVAAFSPWTLIASVPTGEALTVSGRRCDAKVLVFSRP